MTKGHDQGAALSACTADRCTDVQAAAEDRSTSSCRAARVCSCRAARVSTCMPT